MCLGLKIPDKSCFFFLSDRISGKDIFENTQGVRDFEIPIIRIGPKNKDRPIYSDPNSSLTRAKVSVNCEKSDISKKFKPIISIL